MIKEKIEVNNQVMIECKPVEIGPFQLPDSYTVKVIKDTISDIPTAPVSCNLWIDFQLGKTSLESSNDAPNYLSIQWYQE